MIAALTTSRKATVGGLIAALYPVYALLQSEAPIGWRDLATCAVGGVIGFLGVWAPANTEPYLPERRHAANRRGDG